MLPRFRTRDDVINWAEKNLHYTNRVIARAFREGSIEFLGGFSRIGGDNNSGWIVKITSRFNVIHYVTVLCYGNTMLVRCSTIYSVPWKYWDGDKSDNPLYQGDNPKEYGRLKNETKE